MVTGGLLLLAYSRLTQLGLALAVVAAVGCMFGAINAAATPIFLAVIPPNLMGRVMSVFSPLQQVANIGSLGVAGFLAGTILRGFHADIYGITFGPIDTIFTVSALLVTVAGLAMIRPLSAVAAPAQERPAQHFPASRTGCNGRCDEICSTVRRGLGYAGRPSHRGSARAG
jgi:MFS family permease